jgi:hypothetical protein
MEIGLRAYSKERGVTMKTWIGFSLLVTILVLSGPGCATTRAVLLKEYNPSLPPGDPAAFAGKTICVQPFTELFDVGTKLEGSVAAEPAGYEYRKMTDQEEDLWDAEVEKIKDSSTKEKWRSVGWVRNGFGMHMADVYALNPPGEWLKQVIELEVGARSAKTLTADRSGDADLTISGAIKYMKVDIYMKYWADLQVEVNFQPKGKPAFTRTFHTAGGQAAWSSSSFEFYQPIRMCQQKLLLLLMPEIEKALKA